MIINKKIITVLTLINLVASQEIPNEFYQFQLLKLEVDTGSNWKKNSIFGPEGSPERKGWGWFYLIIGIILLCTGALVSKTGSFEIDSWPVRIFIFAVFAGVGFMLIGPKLPWRK